MDRSRRGRGRGGNPLRASARPSPSGGTILKLYREHSEEEPDTPSPSSRPAVPLHQQLQPWLKPSSHEEGSAARTARARTPKSDRPPKNTPLQHSFTFSTPGNNRGLNLRKRARTFDYGVDGNGEDESEVKGGHSLRKRTRVDYALINEDDDRAADPTVPGSANRVTPTAGSRGRKRRMEDDAIDPVSSSAPKKRGRYEKRTESPASRRKQPLRKSSTQRQPDIEQQSDTELKDTIEVGVSLSEVESSDEQSSFKHSDTASIVSGGSQDDQAVSSIAVESPPAEGTVESDDVSSDARDAAEHDIEEQNQQDIITQLESRATTHQEHRLSVETTGTTNDGPIFKTESVKTSKAIMAHTPVYHADDEAESTKLANTKDTVTPSANSNNLTAESMKDVLETLSRGFAGGNTTHPQLQTAPTSTNVEEQQVAAHAQPSIPATKSLVTETTAINGAAPQTGNSQESIPATSPQPDERFETIRDTTPTDVHSTSKDASPHQLLSEARKELQKTKQKGHDDKHIIPNPQKVQKTLSDAPSLEQAVTQPQTRSNISSNPSHESNERSTSATSRRHRQEEVHVPVQFEDGKDFSFITPYLNEEVLYPENMENSSIATPVLATSDPAGNHVPDDNQLGDDNGAEEDIPGDEQQDQAEIQEDDEAINEPDENAAVEDAPTPAADSVAASDRMTPAPNSSQHGAAQSSLVDPIIELLRQQPKARTQYPYKKIRSPTQIMDLIEDFKGMPTPDLYNALSAINGCLVAWQDEYNELRKITDDEDNSVRRRAQDATYEAKLVKDMAKVNPVLTLERDFALKGVRVKEPIYNNEKHYFRTQDRLMSDIYSYEYDPRDSMIGKQDPLLQREGLQNTRLRNRPKQTQKAAEAAEDPAGVILTGKRTRKQRLMSEDSKVVSRAGTPVEPAKKPVQRRRGRKPADEAAAYEEADPNGDYNGAEVASQEVATPEKKGRRRRGPNARQESVAPAAPETVQAEDPQAEPKTRRRRRGPRAKSAVEQEIVKDEPEATHAAPQAKRQRARAGPRVEIPTSTFYNNNPSPADTIPSPAEYERPGSSSSNATAQTVESNYSFRERKRKNYTELADPDINLEPKPKRTRRTKKEASPAPITFAPTYTDPRDAMASPFAAYTPAQASGSSAPQAPPKQRIRVTNGRANKDANLPLAPLAPAPVAIPRLPSSRDSSDAPSKAPSRRGTPAPSATSSAPPAGDDETPKDYASMTKSEKMSNSMRARWANGSMARAVEKRKQTLARKKAAQQEAAHAVHMRLTQQHGIGPPPEGVVIGVGLIPTGPPKPPPTAFIQWDPAPADHRGHQ